MAPEEIYLTPAEVGERIKMNEQTVRKFIRQGKIRASQIGRSYRVSSSAVTEFMAAQEKARPVTDEDQGTK